MKHYYNTIITAVSLFLGLTACVSDDQLDKPSPAKGNPIEVVASIGHSVDTKANPGNGDNISYTSFVTGDEIGFFASGGLVANNEKLTYKTSSFLSESDALQWVDGDATGIAAYYPYNAGTVSDNKLDVNIWRDASTSPEATWKEGFQDFLIATNKESVTNGTLINLSFRHHFAMLIIKRGNGFEAQTGWTEDNKTVKVILNKKVDHTAIFSNPTLTLKVDESAGTQELIANPGKYTPRGEGQIAVDCYYVLIPVGEFDDKSTCQVASITLRNKLGVDITIPYTKALANNYKYLVTAEMRDDVAIIDPEEIVQWTDEELPIEKPLGIEEGTFTTWLSNYNLFKGGTSEQKEAAKEELLKLGTLTAEGWTFLLLEDINVATNSETTASVVVTDFTDVLDGQGHTISGLKLKATGTESKNIGFCGTLSGTIKNLILKDISVDGLAQTGGIAGSMTGGTIDNCKIEGFSLIFGTTNVGGLVGNYTSGKITKCTSSATVSGTGDIDLLVGGNTKPDDLSTCTSSGTLIKRTTNP